MELTTAQKNKILAAAEIVQDGDMAVLKNILEFKDILEDWQAKMEALKAEVEASDLVELKNSFDELSSNFEGFKTEMSDMEVRMANMASEGDKRHAKEMKAMMDKMDSMHKSMKQSIENVKNLIPELPPQFDPTGILNSIRELEAKIPQIPDEITGERMIEKINRSEKKIDKERIDGLEDQIKRLEKMIADKPTGRMGMRKVPIIKRYSLTSQVDGNTRAFTLPRDTVDVLGLWGTQFPITFDPADWTFSGNTLTLAAGITTPSSGQTLHAIIETLFYG